MRPIITTVFCFFFFAQSAIGQYYDFPYIGWKQSYTSATWNGFQLEYGISAGLAFDRDTILGGQQYVTNGFGFYRSDNGKIYQNVYDGQTQTFTERLEFDFSLEVGDPFENYFFDETDSVRVVNKEQVSNLLGETVWRMELERHANFLTKDTLVWIEGVGETNRGIIRVLFPDGSLTHACTLLDDNRKIYINPENTVYCNCDYLFGKDEDNDGFGNYQPKLVEINLSFHYNNPSIQKKYKIRACDTLRVYSDDLENIIFLSEENCQGDFLNVDEFNDVNGQFEYTIYDISAYDNIYLSIQCAWDFAEIFVSPCFEDDCDDMDPTINPNAIDIPGNGIDEDCDPLTNPDGNIQGTVFIDNNSNCIFDAGDIPLECIRVPITWEGQFDPIFYGVTDENGFFEFIAPSDHHYFEYDNISQLWGAEYDSQCFSNGGFLNSGDTITFAYPLDPSIVVPGYISGYVFLDSIANCVFDSTEQTTDNFNVGFTQVGSSDTVSITPLVDGYYGAILEAGTYEVFIQFDGNPNWMSCDTSITVEANMTCRDEVNIPIQPATTCSDFSVSIAANAFRICIPTNINVSYQNIGSVTTGPMVKVVLDTLLTYLTSTIPVNSIDGDTLFFLADPLAPLAYGSFTIEAIMSCDAVLGETHCLEAQITSDNNCQNVSPMWDGSSVKLTGECIGDQLNVKIENIGDAPMSKMLEYIVIEDNILLSQEPFQLGIGQFINLDFTPSGASIHVQAEQSINHPGMSMPAKSFEGCGVNNQGSFSLGFITQYPEDDANLDISIFCMENVNSFDPNDKQGFPRGISEEHYIRANTRLEYMIRFENIGTAAALYVEIMDLISPFLDAQSLRPGASSHPYTYSLTNGNQANFVFENINLPPASADPSGAQGYVTFTIDQTDGNTAGTEIFNLAEIVFDNNAPIVTNTTVHRIPFPIISLVEELDLCNNEWNPDSTYLEITPYLFYETHVLYDLNILPSYSYEVTVNLEPGEEHNGVVYFSDTTIVESLLSQYGCDSISITNIRLLSNTSSIALTNVTIAPNPASDMLYITGLGEIAAPKFDIQVFDGLGRRVFMDTGTKGNKDNMEIDLSELSAGLYYIQLSDGMNTRVEKIIKM